MMSKQALWRGILVRQRSNHLKEELSALRQRMKNTAANVDQKMRLEYRITEALAALLSQKTVSGILHTCATIGRFLMYTNICPHCIDIDISVCTCIFC